MQSIQRQSNLMHRDWHAFCKAILAAPPAFATAHISISEDQHPDLQACSRRIGAALSWAYMLSLPYAQQTRMRQVQHVLPLQNAAVPAGNMPSRPLLFTQGTSPSTLLP